MAIGGGCPKLDIPPSRSFIAQNWIMNGDGASPQNWGDGIKP